VVIAHHRGRLNVEPPPPIKGWVSARRALEETISRRGM
jgi:hypothetical protein